MPVSGLTQKSAAPARRPLDCRVRGVTMQGTLFAREHDPSDVVYTPDWCARDMLDWFRPSGKVLDPCKGGGAFFDKMPSGAEWCEIREGRDFFEWRDPVDWIVSNPPYSNFRVFLNHSFTVADNIVYLVPVKNVFSAYGMLKEVKEYGGIAGIRFYGGGARVNFPMGNAIGAVHFKRGHSGPCEMTHYTPNDQVRTHARGTPCGLKR